MDILKYSIRDSLLVSIIFYLSSNFYVFLYWSLYPKTLYGLFLCYMMAVPFFFNKLSLFSFFVSFAFRYLFCRNNISKKV